MIDNVFHCAMVSIMLVTLGMGCEMCFSSKRLSKDIKGVVEAQVPTYIFLPMVYDDVSGGVNEYGETCEKTYQMVQISMQTKKTKEN